MTGSANGSSRRLRLVFVVARSWPSLGGIESFLHHLTRELGTRHDVTVLAQRIDAGVTGRLSDTLRPPPPFEAFLDGPVRVEPLRVPPPRRLLLVPHAAGVVPVLARHAYGRMRLPLTSLYARVVAPVIGEAAGRADLLHVFAGDLLGAAALRAGRLLGVPVAMTPFAHRGQWGDDPAAAATYR
ncbi:MAG: hypothetical protein H0V40_08135, partial [Actinobacteria bacterium]|nr:hypothetical protein [Actinomycetota bacterium]